MITRPSPCVNHSLNEANFPLFQRIAAPAHVFRIRLIGIVPQITMRPHKGHDFNAESVLRRLMQKGAEAALRQPIKEADVNEVIDAAGFDFVQQPEVTLKARKARPRGQMFTEYILELSEFRARTLATEPEDYKNFETFSMAMLDLDYDGEVFRLGRVCWADDLITEAGGLDEVESIQIRITQAEFTGNRLMVILCDRYGNEKTRVFDKGDFR